MNNKQVFDAIFSVFNWAYDVNLSLTQQNFLSQTIMQNWDSIDNTDRELVSYLLELHEFLSGQTVRNANKGVLQKQVVEIFKKEFYKNESNNRGEILRQVHQILENLKPNCTMVPIAVSGSSMGVPPTPNFPTLTPQNTGNQAALDAQAILRKEQQAAQKLQLESQIQALRHQTTMSIINNIK